MYVLKSTLLAFLILLSFSVFSQDSEDYVRVKFENTASYTFTIKTPSSITLQPRTGKWVNAKVGEEIKFMKMLKKRFLVKITPEMHNTIIDASATAKLRNKDDAENIVYLRPPKDKMVQPEPAAAKDEYLVLNEAEIMPSFILGPEKMVDYINANLQYPEAAKANNTTGIVVVDFVVDEDGKITESNIGCDIGDGCGEAALQLVNNMPAWNSGLVNDEPVAVNMKFPVRFGLEEGEKIWPFERVMISDPNEPNFWEIRTHSYIKSFIGTHKKVAILPASVEIIDKKLIKKNRSEPEEVAEKENELSKSFQQAFHKRLAWLTKKEKLTIEVQDIAETTEILAKNDLSEMGNLLSLSQNEVAEFLGVDAIFYPDIRLVQVMTKGASALLSMATNVNADADASNLNLDLYDGCSGMSVWKFSQEMYNSSLFWKTEKLIEMMFKQEMDKKFPYHIKYRDQTPKTITIKR